MNNKFNNHLDRLEKILLELMNSTEIPAAKIKEAILYSLFPGGKRIRPLLVYLTGELLDASVDCLDLIAASIELTHCYSLVHDDLPAMDNDDFRRGKPSCHRAFDEATAILAGDGMQALAMEILLTRLPVHLSADNVVAIALELSKASGISGMVSGQSLDLTELSQKAIDEKQLRLIHSLKTGKLIIACINMTIAASNANLIQQQALQSYASHLGLVFQMQDDYFDQYGQPHILGKGRSSDSINQKTTYANLYDQVTLSSLIEEHYLLAKKALSIFGDAAEDLLMLTTLLQNRSKDNEA